MLAATLLAAVTLAIELYLGLLDVSRTEVEQAQLARALLRRMADDLRSAVAYQPIDYAQLVPETPTGMESELPDELAEAAGGELPEAEPDRSADLARSSRPQSIPGLFGNASELQVDVSRLPHVDAWSLAAGAAAVSPGLEEGSGQSPNLQDGPGQIPNLRGSDVKTVLYYVADGGAAQPAAGAAEGERSYGLVRRETDRATTAYAAEQGNLAALEAAGQVLAPEVVALQFAYFDGSEVTDTWDSIERDGLPLAVEITLVIEKPRRRDSRPASMAEAIARSERQGDYLVYRQLVHLPTAVASSAEQGVETEEEAAP